VQLVCIGTLDSLASSARPVADAASATIGALGATIVSGGAILLLLGVLLALLLGNSRTLFAMGEQAQMPQSVASVHPRLRTPLVAIVTTSTGALLATLASTFTSAITAAVGTRVLTYLVICAALPILRRRRDVPPARLTLPAGDLIAGCAILGSLALLAAMQAREGIALAALLGIGLAAQRLFRRDL
jgi:amino acid transporter